MGRCSVARRAARLVAVRLVPVRRTEARVVAGSDSGGLGGASGVADGREPLVRVPRAERLVVVGDFPAPRAVASEPSGLGVAAVAAVV
ncbi:MAG TPA: hypothetical protein VES19_04420 [Candidatus Limnocylindrales bacterium]|nr:hypothetical protein [Candidatus Limnocylindrales bacterium]